MDKCIMKALDLMEVNPEKSDWFYKDEDEVEVYRGIAIGMGPLCECGFVDDPACGMKFYIKQDGHYYADIHLHPFGTEDEMLKDAKSLIDKYLDGGPDED